MSSDRPSLFETSPAGPHVSAEPSNEALDIYARAQALAERATQSETRFRRATPDELLEGLNPNQRDGVMHTGGPLLIVAGAGSGKTRVLTSRIAYLIAVENVSPFEILAITFTNKAADEMRQRVAKLVGPVAEKMWVSTFHSACVRMLRRDAHRLGYGQSFTIYDQADAVRLTQYVLRDLNVDPKKFPPRSVHAVISAAKNDLVGAPEYQQRAANIYERRIGEIYAEYQKRLLAASAMDFDDLLLQTVRLLQQEPEVLQHYQRRFKHILVDEYQDTNCAQNEIVLLLGEQHHNVTVVGDSDQCLVPGTLVGTPTGRQAIEGLAVGDRVRGADGTLCAASAPVVVTRATRYVGPLVTLTVGSRALSGTPHHLVPANTQLPPDRYVVYLMHRADRGWRVGRTSAVRSSSTGERTNGLKVRTGQEHADGAWILKVCSTLVEAVYWESRLAAQFGLPTACFHAVGRKSSALDDQWLVRFYDDLDTDTPAKELLSSFLLSEVHPHYRPQNGLRRQTINLTMFSDVRSSVAYHRVQWSSNRPEIATRIRDAGYSVREGRKPGSWRFETSRADYREALHLARAVAEVAGLDIRSRISVAGAIYELLPLASVHPGMSVLVEQPDGTFAPERVDVRTIEDYDGPVHDLEVAHAHTYIANGILVHNSIYRFRGADIRNILEFEQAFPDTTIVVLDQNYRSTQNILDAANAVIANNSSRKPKHLWSDSGAGFPITRYHAEDERDEAGWIAREMARLHVTDNIRWGDMAVFYRTNASSRVVEEQLVRVGIPYKVVGGTKFYDRREVKDVLAYVRALMNPADEVSIKRVINVPKRGVGDTSIGRIDNWARGHGRTFSEGLPFAEEAGLTGRALAGVRSFLSLLDELRLIERGPGEVLQAVLDKTGYVADLEAENSIESAGRLENLAELVGQAKDFETIEDFLETVSLVADAEEVTDDDSQVVLMTLHTAKGLEFPVVFVIGLEDGVFPHIRSLGEPEELEEERRLAYVGITRARQRLYLTHAWCRSLFGSTQYNPVSRFISEIPANLVSNVGEPRRSQQGPGWSGGASGSGYGRSWQGGDRGRRGDADDGIPSGRVFGAARHKDNVVEAAMRSASSAPVATTGAESLGLQAGDDIMHTRYGEGRIVELMGTGDKTEAVVRFVGVGEKRFLLAFTPLKKAR